MTEIPDNLDRAATYADVAETILAEQDIDPATRAITSAMLAVYYQIVEHGPQVREGLIDVDNSLSFIKDSVCGIHDTAASLEASLDGVAGALDDHGEAAAAAST